MELPSLESVSVPWVGCLEFGSGRRGNLMGLKVLELVQTSVAPASLGALLLRTPRVERLVYDFWPGSEAHLISLSDVQTALVVLKPTLRELVLRIKPGQDDPANTAGSVQGDLGSLSSFTNLTKLETSIMALYGNTTPYSAAPLETLLPTSLRHLTITDDFFEHPDFVPWLSYPLFDFIEEFLAQNDELEVNQVDYFTLDVETNTYVLTEDGILDVRPMDEDDFIVVRSHIEDAGMRIGAQFVWREWDGI